MALNGSSPKLRVLHVPDYVPWVTGTIARRLAHHNPWMESTICSLPLLRELVARGTVPEGIDLVHFQIAEHGFEFIDHFAGKVPCVATVHHVESRSCLGPEPRFDAIATVSMQWHRELIATGVDPAKLVLVPNGVDADRFHPPTLEERRQVRARLGLPEDAFVVGFAAKRTSDSSGRKGIDTLEAALAEVARRVPDAACMILGPGWHDLVERQRAAGLRCGYIPYVQDHADVAAFYRGLDAYWITSRIEGGPVPLLEAMAGGVCCVATPVGMVGDLIRDGENGLIVPFNDPGAVIDRTRRLAEGPDLRRSMGEAARRTILEGYQWWQASPKVHELYRVAIERFRSRPGSPAVVDIPPADPAPPRDAPGEVPLAAFPAKGRAWVSAREELALAMMLHQGGEHKLANRTALRVIAARPFDRTLIEPALWVLPHGPTLIRFTLGPIRWAKRTILAALRKGAGSPAPGVDGPLRATPGRPPGP